MKTVTRIRSLMLLFGVSFSLFVAVSASQTEPPAKYPAYPSETPVTLQPATDGFDYIRREVMIPMRDGVKLHTVILVPKGAKNAPRMAAKPSRKFWLRSGQKWTAAASKARWWCAEI